MDWTSHTASADKIKLAQACVEVSTKLGWSDRTLDLAAQKTTGVAWPDHFPNGSVDTIWFISDISDASMRRAFDPHRATNIAAVVSERLQQNATLKGFVMKVMKFDVLHPIQAIKRMQRTARIMFTCLSDDKPGEIKILLVNILYTLVVFFWLFDRSHDNINTEKLTKLLLSIK